MRASIYNRMRIGRTHFLCRGDFAVKRVAWWIVLGVLFVAPFQHLVARAQEPGKILNVQLLGHQDKLRWKQDKQGLQVRMPAATMSDIGVTFKVTLA